MSQAAPAEDLDRLIAGAGNALYAATAQRHHIGASRPPVLVTGFQVEISDWQSAPACRSRSIPGHAELSLRFGQRTGGRTVR